MVSEGACAMLEPLNFPEPANPASHFSFIPWETGKCTCPLCDRLFDVTSERDDLYAHLYTDHKMVIADAQLITSTKGYFDYWKVRFSQEPLTNFCTVMTMENENYYLLSDVHPEDLQLRRGLANKRLEWVLDYQKKEREDASFNRCCLFCRHVEKSSRSNYLTHLSYQHNLQLGRPDNLVFIDKLIDKIEEKLNKLECIYCEHTFKDRTVLKEHMRKKFHKRVNPKNKEYDRFYVVSYLEGGQQDDPEEPQPQDAWAQWREEGSDWSDWQEEPSPIVCLFCPFTCGEWDDVISHMLMQHKFCYSTTMGKLNFYEQVKVVNYIRREIYMCHCYECGLKFQTRELLLEHMTTANHFTLPDSKNWNHPEFFFPTYENDTFLCLLEDNEEDPVDQLSSQLLNDFTMHPEPSTL
ncbi:hypothetical protein RUM43_005436 [Polyplax serrata]|uniref:C2H2-type domain-containing protein n=1 Tax=Polyplax serrata TaxID=468196 RepID=A0AAN8PB80_POLSC